MGIEIWALVVLVAVLVVYLLPLLVGRREVMGLSRAQDRYSGSLRVLATGSSSRVADETCAVEVDAEIFKYRPEVRAMNRPAVRNVRALRTERELARARRTHEEGRERRRVAASHRAVIACVLLGVLLGASVVAWVTVLPWWPALVPAGLLVVSVVAGRRAALAAAEAERRERRRVARLETELARLATPVRGSVGAAPDEPGASARARQAAEDAPGARVPEPQTGTPPVEAHSRDTGTRDVATAEPGTPASSREETVAHREDVVPVAHDEEHGAPAEEPTTSTPPQGWAPVRVPAPTYTLVAAARPREVTELDEADYPTAPVPARPASVRALAPVENEVAVAATIDLDAVLERRRAAGA